MTARPPITLANLEIAADSGDPEAKLVVTFALALFDKLEAAERKHGWNRAWMRDGWADDLRRDIRQHVDKGDPLDVAAYAAFAWSHGWPLGPGLAVVGCAECLTEVTVRVDCETCPKCGAQLWESE